MSGVVTVEFSEEMRDLFAEQPNLNIDILNDYKDLFLDVKYNDQKKETLREEEKVEEADLVVDFF